MFLSVPPEGAPHRPPRLARPQPQPLPRLADPARALPAPGERTEDFWAEVRRLGTPLVGPDPRGAADHAAVTFLWRGTPATRAVQVLPNKLGDPRDPEGNLMARVPGTDVWHWTLRLRQDWRGTYELYVDEGDGPERGTDGYWPWLRTRRGTDPFNRRTLQRRWDGGPVSYAELPATPRAVDWAPRPGVPRGTAPCTRCRPNASAAPAASGSTVPRTSRGSGSRSSSCRTASTGSPTSASPVSSAI
jgi:enterochelin esterase family protein